MLRLRQPHSTLVQRSASGARAYITPFQVPTSATPQSTSSSDHPVAIPKPLESTLPSCTAAALPLPSNHSEEQQTNANVSSVQSFLTLSAADWMVHGKRRLVRSLLGGRLARKLLRGPQEPSSLALSSSASHKNATWAVARSFDRLANNNNNNNNSTNTNKKKGNGEEDGDNENGDSTEDDVTPRVTLFVVGAILLSLVLDWLARPGGKACGWATISQHAQDITAVHIYDKYVMFYTKEKGTFHIGTVDDTHLNQKLNELHAKYAPDQKVEVVMHGTPLAERVLYAYGLVAWVVPFIFFPSFVMMLTRAMGTAVTSSDGRNKIKQMSFKVQSSSDTKFFDVAGMREAKREITEIVDFLKRPDRYTRLGAKIPTGALLLGPPGTGKTLLAKAVAGEAGIAFIPVCGSDFVELYVGMGALRVRQLFETAKKQRCIVFIDEIDAIGLKRRGAGHGEKQEQEHTLNELLTQLDGFGSNRGQVMILASSNVPQDQLDPALIRPGRFDRIVHVDAPVVQERVEIFKMHLSRLKLVEEVVTPKSSTTEAAAVASPPEESSGDAESKPVATTAAADVAPSAPTVEAAAARPASGALAVVPGSRPAIASPFELDYDPANPHSKKPSSAFPAEFDIEAKLATKTPAERLLIDNFAERMSKLCPGFVGADIANVCNEGAILAARENAPLVTIEHLERSIDRVLAGIEHRSRVLSDFEKNVVAHHEAGHAIAGWFLNRADPLMKVSIIPRGGSALGYAQYLPNENKMQTANEIVERMCVTLGGRVAELIFFNHLSTGASDDLQKVTRMAYTHVTNFRPSSVYNPPGTSATRYVKPFGTVISDRIDDAAKQLIDDAFQRTMTLLTSKKAEMEMLAKHLLTHEFLTHQDVVNYLGERDARENDMKKGR